MNSLELVSKDKIEEYLKGTPAESSQFDFLLGHWNTKLEKFDAAGNVIANTHGRWHGRWLHDRRIFFDEFHSYVPGGKTQISYMSTLRTYDPSSAQWEMTFLVAHQPPVLSRFYGRLIRDQVHLNGEGKTVDGKFFSIKVCFFNISKSGFTWEDQISFDEGQNWRPQSRISASAAA